ncbi:MAG: hypothetical protein ABL903_08840 [Methylococcales bacterium]
MKKFSKTPFSMAISTVISASFTISAASAGVNPFAMTEISQSTQQLAGVVPFEKSGVVPVAKPNATPHEMSCGAMMKDQSGHQMGDMKGKGEMSCGAMMKNMSKDMNPEEMKAMCHKKMAEEKDAKQ